MDSKRPSGAPLGRREIIKRGLALGALSYVAPKIIGASTSVHAQVISGFGCSNLAEDCEDENALCLQENPDNENDCGCFNTVDDDPICIRLECGDPCTESSDCDPGWFCMQLPCDPDCSGVDGAMCMEACSPAIQFSTSGFGRGLRRSSWPAMALLR